MTNNNHPGHVSQYRSDNDISELIWENCILNTPPELKSHEQIKLFGIIPIASKKIFTDGVIKIYFLGVPILKISN